MAMYVMGEVSDVQVRTGVKDGRDWAMKTVELIVRRRRSSVVEVLLRGDAEEEAEPARGDMVAFEVEVSARVWNNVPQLNFVSERRARELEEAVGIARGLHSVEA